MRIIPQQKLRDRLLYNNICFIVCIFCIVCFVTALFYQHSFVKEKTFYDLRENAIFGPIKIDNKSQVYRVTAYFSGDNTSSYISGEVLDEDKDTIYEFGKDLWHESGYDSEGYWSESERRMSADLTFSEKGTYYIQFNTEENSMKFIKITVQLKKGSYVAHLEVGSLALLLVLFVWIFINKKWVKEKLVVLNDKLEEMSDD